MSYFISFYASPSVRNAVLVEMNGVKFWYSFSRLVAVEWDKKDGSMIPVVRRVHKAVLGSTVGAHLNAIDGGNKRARALRIEGAEWKFAVKQALKAAKLSKLPIVSFTI